ncbi:hypothetical protein DUNSADRAFT_7460 [Dunaliella salina]|uniref:Uncharacterized protein n=1 Tax=Dunaliella salina TaxID=3046 RepID=A0ABQ7GLD1_DUNSA|nr:hypothetical protein DUNSADRAFT_7460 [Dunaliella salina]|eukprot:KAF5835425.1 hypothetical protein DUNSADRAFT_7460 [Dunaliella salina]
MAPTSPLPVQPQPAPELQPLPLPPLLPEPASPLGNSSRSLSPPLAALLPASGFEVPISAQEIVQVPAPQHHPLNRLAPDPRKLSIVQERCKRLLAVAHSGDIDLVLARCDSVLDELEPTMPSSQFAMGSIEPASKRMRTTSKSTLRHTHTTGIWKGAATKPGRPNVKRASASAKQPQGRGAAILSSARPVVSVNYSPFSKRRAQLVANFGRQPNFELFSMTSADVPEFVPLSLTATPPEQYPEPPVDFSSRLAYFANCAPIDPTFKQRTQPWFAARSVACTASATAAILGVGFGYSDNHFRMFDEQQQPQPLQDISLPMEWGLRHEMCGIAPVMRSLKQVPLPVIRAPGPHAFRSVCL